MRIIHGKDGKLKMKLQEEPGVQLHVYDAMGRMAGYYLPRLDRTYDANGHYVGTGDQRTSLCN